MITDAKEKACVFNEYFCAQCRLDSEIVVLPPLPDITITRFISNITTNVTEVNNLLKGIDISKACDVDGVGNHLLKLCADGISPSFASIINISFSTGVFPKAWKFANVISISKKANRQHKKNYRPISLLPALSKIPEKIVFNRLYNFLLDINFLSPYQSGFRPGNSTVNQLIYIVHKIHEALDISKAFDKVWHKGLIFKLKTIGVRGPLLTTHFTDMCIPHYFSLPNGVRRSTFDTGLVTKFGAFSSFHQYFCHSRQDIDYLSPSRRREAPCEDTNSHPAIYTRGNESISHV